MNIYIYEYIYIYMFSIAFGNDQGWLWKVTMSPCLKGVPDIP